MNLALPKHKSDTLNLQPTFMIHADLKQNV